MKRDALTLLSIMAGVTLFVAHKIGNAFVYDDTFVVNGPLIHDPSRIPSVFANHAMLAQGQAGTMPMDTYRPISILSFFWDAWLSGYSTWSYHLSNHLFHLICVALVFALAKHVLPDASRSVHAFAALFFGLSPQLAEAHVWINGRSDPLTTLFGLSAILLWSHANQKPSVVRDVGAAALLFCGLLCKEVLLFALPSLALWPTLRASSLRARALRLAPFAVSGVAYLGVRTTVLDGLKASHGKDQLLLALSNVPVLWLDGLRELISPSRLYMRSMRHEYALLSGTQRAWIAAAVLLVFGLVFLSRKKLPLTLWGLTWFALCLAPASMITGMMWPGFGRYLYLPCVGVAIASAELLSQARIYLARREDEHPSRAMGWIRGSGALILSVYLLSLGVRLASVTFDYRSDEALFGGAAKLAPQPAYAHAWLGASFRTAGHPLRGIEELEKAVAADRAEPKYLHDLVVSYLDTKQPAKAATAARYGIARAPRGAAGDLHALLIRSLALTDPPAAWTATCNCLRDVPQYLPCRAAVLWLLSPKQPRAAELTKATGALDKLCASPSSREFIRSRQAATNPTPP